MRNVKRFNLPKGVELVTIGELIDAADDGEVWEFYLSSGGRVASAWASIHRTDEADWQHPDRTLFMALYRNTPSGTLVPARKLSEAEVGPRPLVEVLGEETSD